MKVITFHLPDELLSQANDLVKTKKFKDRSELIRTAVRDLIKKDKLMSSAPEGLDIDTYLKITGFVFDKAALIGNGNKATIIYKNSETDTTVQVIKNCNRETILEAVKNSSQTVRG